MADDTDDIVAQAARLWLLPPDDPNFPENRAAKVRGELAQFLGGDFTTQDYFGGPEYLGRPTPRALPDVTAELTRRFFEQPRTAP